MSPPNWIGLTNYQELLQDNGFWHALLDTGFFVVMTVIFQTTLPLLVANLLNSGIRGSTIFRTIYFMPVIISLTVTGLLWSMNYEPNFGLLNSLLKAFGLVHHRRFDMAVAGVLPGNLFCGTPKHPAGPVRSGVY